MVSHQRKKTHPRNLTRPQDVFNGIWNEVSKTNIDEFLKKIGYNWAVRKVANVMGMTLVIKGSSTVRFLCFWIFYWKFRSVGVQKIGEIIFIGIPMNR